MNPPCEFLPWDSDFFGVRIARVNGHRLEPSSVVDIEQWCKAERIDCLYFLADFDHPDTTRLAEDHGFRLVDARLTFEQKLLSPVSMTLADDILIRPSRLDDLPALKVMARGNFRDTRYYFDPCFPDLICDAFYEFWIERSFKDYADIILVAENASLGVIGYISCALSDDKMQGTIGLIGVADAAQGRGVGRLLVRRVLEWQHEAGAQIALVSTQVRNIAAQRLYQRCGYVSQSVRLWYHKWFTDCG